MGTLLRHTAVIEHRGRRSGKSYQTPVIAFVEGDSLSVVLNYGEQSDWVRNVMAAGSAQVVNHDKRYTLSHPRVVSNDSAELPVAVQKSVAPHAACCTLHFRRPEDGPRPFWVR